MELIKVEISDELVVEVQPNSEHEWLLSSKDVAEGYGLSDSSLRSAKSRYSDELLEGTHWVVANSNTLGGTQKTKIAEKYIKSGELQGFEKEGL